MNLVNFLKNLLKLCYLKNKLFHNYSSDKYSITIKKIKPVKRVKMNQKNLI